MDKNEIRDIEKKMSEAYKRKITILDTDSTFKFGCNQCGKCCTTDIVNSILLNPYDVFKLAKGKGVQCEEILNYVKANVCIGDNSGIPIINLQANKDGECPFLEYGKCSVHANKPSSCSLYPLGRITTDKETLYFLQDINCGNHNIEQKVSDWFNSHKKTEEEATAILYEMLKAIEKFISLKHIKKLLKANNFLSNLVEEIYDATFYYLYVGYDTSEEFLAQFKRNVKTIENIFLVFASSIKDYAKHSSNFEEKKYILNELCKGYMQEEEKYDKMCLERRNKK